MNRLSRVHVRPADAGVVALAAAIVALSFIHYGRLGDRRRRTGPEVTRLVSRPLPPESVTAAAARLKQQSPFGVPAELSTTTAPSFAPSVFMERTSPARLQQYTLHAVAGPPWTAIITGLPDHLQQTVVSVGDTIGNVRIRMIRRDTVILQVADSTIRLTLPRRSS